MCEDRRKPATRDLCRRACLLVWHHYRCVDPLGCVKHWASISGCANATSCSLYWQVHSVLLSLVHCSSLVDTLSHGVDLAYFAHDMSWIMSPWVTGDSSIFQHNSIITLLFVCTHIYTGNYTLQWAVWQHTVFQENEPLTSVLTVFLLYRPWGEKGKKNYCTSRLQHKPDDYIKMSIERHLYLNEIPWNCVWTGRVSQKKSCSI